ncbi:GntR family transcriptional regulator [Amycolatopsis ultiminotia]|uniref:GntR family transcriptional regulator n=1 Tax=Amycolatopsis ultiminotia TaxID=543629 RepID=A0ABP6WMQ1_9PSEU
MTDTPSSTSPVASQRIADVIGDRILRGQLAPGTRIIQDEIAEELNASRLPVREALRILESRGLVTLRANAGAWVSRMDLHDCELSYTIRERIEPLLLAESIPRLDDRAIESLAAIQQEISRCTDVEQFLVLDRQFHWTSYSGHQAPRLATMIERLWDTTQHYRRAFTRLGRSEAWIIDAEHDLLVESIRTRDIATATSILETHIRRTKVKLALHPELFER